MKLRTGLQLGTFFPIVVAFMVLANVSVVWFYAPRSDGRISLLMSVTVVIAVVALLMAGALYRTSNRMMRRIGDMELAAARVRSGDLQSLVQPHGRDEIGEVADTFNEMVTELRGYVQLIAAHDAARRELAALRASVSLLRHTQMEVSDRIERLRRVESVLVPRAAHNAGAGVVLRCCTAALEELALVRQTLADAATGRNQADWPAITASLEEAAGSLRPLAAFCAPSDPSDAVCVRAVADEAASLAQLDWISRPQPAGTRVTIRNNVGEDARLKVDRAALLHVLVPLIVNAGESMAEGGVVRMELERSSQGNFLLSVIDFGCGMSAAVKSRCFEPFFSTRPDAAGVGLSTVAHIAQQQGWKVGVVTEPGNGTTVCLELPPEPLRAAARPAAAAAGASPALRVLLVEDDEDLRGQLALGLSKVHRIHATANGAEALAAFDARPFDVVLTDRGMPEMSGDELAAEVRRKVPDMPVVMITGTAHALLDNGIRLPNVDVVLGKPLSAEAVLAALARIAPRTPPSEPRPASPPTTS